MGTYRLMETTEKWICEICTYKNYPATKRCAICYTPKLTENKISSELENEIDEISLEKCSLKPTVETKNTTTRNRNACSTSSSKKVSEFENQKSEENEEAKSEESEVKWQCKSCTFLNYPKSAKCSMCQELRDPENSPKSQKSPEKSLKVSSSE